MFITESSGMTFLANKNRTDSHKVTDHLDTKFRTLLTNTEDEDTAHGRAYRLGDKLQMPRVCCSQHHTNPVWAGPDVAKRAAAYAEDFPGTILHRYYQYDDAEELPPSVTRLERAVNDYLDANRIEELTKEVNRDDTLVIHIRTGDYGNLRSDVIQHMGSVAQGFRKHIVCLGMHNTFTYYHGRSENETFLNFHDACKDILRQLGNTCKILLGGADQHCSIMCKARNLYVHKGGFSCLVSLLCRGNIYCSPKFAPLSEDNEVWLRMRSEIPVISIRDASGTLVDLQKRLEQISERKAKELADRKAKELADRKAKELAERKAKELAERKAKERKAKELAERKAKELAERKAKELADRKAKELADRKAKELADRKAKELAERKAKELAERKAKELAERKAKELVERIAKTSTKRRARVRMRRVPVISDRWKLAFLIGK